MHGVLSNGDAYRFSSYVLTKDSYKEVTATSPMFAVDCEMCLTTSGNLELTRISVVDESMNVSRTMFMWFCAYARESSS